jgi:hypothetical protein
METKKEIFFRNSKHTFKAIINTQSYDGRVLCHTIKIGGAYDDCVNLTVSVNVAGVPEPTVRLGHIESYPDCGYSTFLMKGEGADMLRVSLQFLKSIFPTIRRFKFEDASKIDCGITKNRKMEKPLSLAHLHLVIHGKSWYEDKFNAYLLNDITRRDYSTLKEKLSMQIPWPYELVMLRIPETSREEFRPYYEAANGKTWIELFRSIPRSEHCAVFFNWLPNFVEDIILGDKFPTEGWIIDIDTMPKTEMQILDGPPQRGGGTRKRRRNRLHLTNKKDEHSHGFIFDGDYEP